MRLRILLATTLFASALIGVVPAVSAQGVIIDEGGVRVVPQQGRGYDRYDRQDRQDSYDRGIGPRDARRIARGAGMADVNSVGRRGRAWIVDGEDYRGRDIRVTISARSGEVMDVQRYRR
ncbi:PepSY domain-containing protein [Kaistia sp. UC242_56]|uniref:PepSY domain-containing protein n=1 Tax=Kaistia sp. UC242_56 TaxID=3374625 RepID=UPI00379BF907